MDKCKVTNCQNKVIGKIQIMNKTYSYCKNKLHINIVLLKFRVENNHLFNKKNNNKIKK
ncbi:MAG: hypothetical protein ACRC8P_00285 [Spiroplasma sp.]